jgi:hypothetical protein
VSVFEFAGNEIDRVVFQYSRAAKELWKFCNHLQVEVAAAMIRGAAAKRLVGTRSAKRAVTTGGSTAATVLMCRDPHGHTEIRKLPDEMCRRAH